MRVDTAQSFYHINRTVAWSSYKTMEPGVVIDAGGSTNPYFAFFQTYRKTYPVTPPDGNTVQVPGRRFFTAAQKGEINAPELANIAADFSQHLVAYLRELIWEDVRRREFPHLPSRQRCIWLIPTINGVKYWLKRMGTVEDFQVIQVSVQGRLHTTSESHLLGEAEPLNAAIEMARLYWLGVVENEDTQEVIFEGRVEVEKILDQQEYA